MNRMKDMTHGSPIRLILLFALPLMLGNLGQQFYMIVDTIIVGQGVGVSALAALGATDWVYWLVLWTIQAMTQGFSILITQNFGAGDEDRLRQSVALSTLLCGALGVLLTIGSLLLASPLLRLLGTPAEIFSGAQSYLLVMFGGTMIVMAYNMAAAILRAFGDGKTPLIAMGIAAAVNIGLDLLFVLVFGWGIVGAGIATLIAQLGSFLYCLRILRRMPILRMRREDWRPDRAVIGKLCRLGFPLAFQHIVITIGGMILQSVINSFGFVFVAGFTATNKLYGMLESSAISFGFSTSTYMAQNWGARKMDRLDMGIRSAMILSTVVSVSISVLMLIFGRSILSLFVSAGDANASEVLDVAVQYLRIMSITLLALYVLHTYRSALQGLGNTVAPMISGFIEFAMRVGAAMLLPRLMGATGILFAETSAWIGAAIFLVYAYYRQVRELKAHAALFEPVRGAPEEGSGHA